MGKKCAKKGGARAPWRDLVHLLPDYRVTGAEVSLVSPPTAYEPTRVGLLRDFLATRPRPLMQPCSERDDRRTGA